MSNFLEGSHVEASCFRGKTKQKKGNNRDRNTTNTLLNPLVLRNKFLLRFCNTLLVTITSCLKQDELCHYPQFCQTNVREMTSSLYLIK